MKIDISDTRFSPYTHLSFALSDWAKKNKKECDLIVDIRTGILGKDRILAIREEFLHYGYVTDWYEGGDLELLGITPVDDIEEMKYKM